MRLLTKLYRIAFATLILVAVAASAYAGWPRRQFDMVAELASLAAKEGVWNNSWDKPNEKIAVLLAELKAETDPGRRVKLRRELAQRYLYANATEAAIATLEELLKDLEGAVPREWSQSIKADLAFAYFRLGEVQNCTWSHNADSCLFPIQGKGTYQQQAGTLEAAKLYAELLDDPQANPDHALAYRWLLNISYMTAGQYPDMVPQRWLIPPQTFRSSYDIGQFRDVALTRGIEEFGNAGGAILEDFDNDGNLDLMISHQGIMDQIQYFHNNGDGTFSRMTEQAGLKGIVGGLNIIQADYNNDGCIDVLVLRGAWLHDAGKFPPSLLRNNCNNTFTDVTEEAGLLQYLPTQTAVWADFNNDGLLDLFVGYEIARKDVKWPGNTKNFELYLNNGDGTFRAIGSQSGIRLDAWIKGTATGDYDNDGWQDIYVSTRDGGGNHLFRNLGADSNGIPKFADVTAQAGVAEPLRSFACWFFDYNNDGWPDIFVAAFSTNLPNIVREYLGDKGHAAGDRPRLYRNNKDGTFTDVSHEVGLDQLMLTMGANFGDLDNDGWLDFYLGTGDPSLETLVPNRMFRNFEGKFFQDVTTSGGFGHLQKGHGVAFGDIDNDGNQDIVEEMGGAFASDKFWTAVYENPGHDNHWVKLRLVGVKANRFAVGARIRIGLTESGKSREVFYTVSSGGSFGGNSLRPHIGLGKATSIDALEIRWPGSGLVQQFKGPIAADRIYAVSEGQQELKVVANPVLAASHAGK